MFQFPSGLPEEVLWHQLKQLEVLYIKLLMYILLLVTHLKALGFFLPTLMENIIKFPLNSLYIHSNKLGNFLVNCYF